MPLWNRINSQLQIFVVVSVSTGALPCMAGGPSDAHSVLMIAPNDENHDTATASIAEAIEAQVSDLDVTVEVRRTDSLPGDAPARTAEAAAVLQDPRYLAVLWCVPEDAQYRAFVYFRSGDGSATPSPRGVEVAGAEGTGETVAVIVRASVVALLDRLEGSTEGPSASTETESTKTVSAPPPMPAATLDGIVSPPPHDERRELLMVEAAYEMTVPSSEGVPLHGANLSVAVRGFSFVRFHLSYTIIGPFRLSRSGTDLTIRHHPIGLGTAFFWARKIFELRLRMSVLIDYATSDFSSEDTSLEVGSAAGQTSISLQSRLEGAVFLVSHLKFFMGVGFDAFLNRPKYTVEMTEGPATVFDPWPVQPVGTAGLSVDFF